MEKRTWLAVLLMCGIWFGYVQWFAPQPPVKQTAPATSAAAPEAASSSVKGELAPTTGPSEELFAVPPPSQSVGYSNGKMDVGFSKVGGKISHLTLTKYKKSVAKDAQPIELIDPERTPQLAGEYFTNPELSELSKSEYAIETKGNVVTLQTTNKGIHSQKTFTFSENSNLIDAEYRITLPPGKKELGFLIFPLGTKQPVFDAHDPLMAWEAVSYQNEKVTRHTIDSIKPEDQVLQGQTGWAAYGNKYFTTAIVTQSEINPDVIFTKRQNFTGVYLRYPLVLKEGQKEIVIKTKIYSGPKDMVVFSQFAGMKKLVDYGTFEFFAHALLAILKFFYGIVHNYGVSIILLTILVRVLFYPLSVKSMRSMKAMQKLQPQIAAIKEKYKDDMKKQNEEQMALFKTHKVNPAGGCLPMLLQLPVFIALYAVLGNSIELFQAPFFGWIKDLSVKDPYYIYPVLMGLAMLMQQKMTPSVGMDPVQQKMMYFMPLIFTFMMINLPSGLTMYIFVSTLLGIVQQVSMRDPKNISAPLVPAGTK